MRWSKLGKTGGVDLEHAPEALTVRQVMSILGVGHNTVYKLISERVLAGVRFGSKGRWHIAKMSVARMLDEAPEQPPNGKLRLVDTKENFALSLAMRLGMKAEEALYFIGQHGVEEFIRQAISVRMNRAVEHPAAYLRKCLEEGYSISPAAEAAYASAIRKLEPAK